MDMNQGKKYTIEFDKKKSDAFAVMHYLTVEMKDVLERSAGQPGGIPVDTLMSLKELIDEYVEKHHRAGYCESSTCLYSKEFPPDEDANIPA